MTKHGIGTYREGFIEGWRSVNGTETIVPEILARLIPAGKTPYQTGYDHGVESARKARAKP